MYIPGVMTVEVVGWGLPPCRALLHVVARLPVQWRIAIAVAAALATAALSMAILAFWRVSWRHNS